MKTKHIAAVIVSALAVGGTLGVIVPAAAQDYAGRDYPGRDYPGPGGDYGRQGGRSHIIVRTEQGQFVIDRQNPLFQRLLDRPFQFRPGFTYIYTDRCNRDGCMVIEQAPWARQPSDRFFAPYVRFNFASDEGGDRGAQNDSAAQDDGAPQGDYSNQGSAGLDSDARQAGGDDRDSGNSGPSPDEQAPPPIHPSDPPPNNTTGHTSHDDHTGLLGGPN